MDAIDGLLRLPTLPPRILAGLTLIDTNEMDWPESTHNNHFHNTDPEPPNCLLNPFLLVPIEVRP